jgi:hypothetical protein
VLQYNHKKAACYISATGSFYKIQDQLLPEELLRPELLPEEFRDAEALRLFPSEAVPDSDLFLL